MRVTPFLLGLGLLLASCTGDISSDGSSTSTRKDSGGSRDAAQTVDVEQRSDAAAPSADQGLSSDAITCTPGTFLSCDGPNAFLRCAPSGRGGEHVDCGTAYCSPTREGCSAPQ